MTPPLRVTVVRDVPVGRGDHVLYWMIAQRRTRWNHALAHAVAQARALDRPLVILEPLRAGYRHASDRLHRFVLDGMADNAAACAKAGVTYLPYVERAAGAGRGLLAALAARAALVVTDEYPTFFLPRMVAAAGAALPVRVEAVDGGGILPLRAFDRADAMAVHFRWAWQKAIAPHLDAPPPAEPLARLPRALRDGAVPGAILRRWPMGADVALAALPIDHAVAPVAYAGGARAAAAALDRFVRTRLDRYDAAHDHPDDDGASGLSPYLHFGHVAAHEVLARALAHAGWDRGRVAPRATGDRAGWWGAPPAVEAFAEQLVTWRELSLQAAHHAGDQTTWASLPAWARATLDAHARDPRPALYTRAQLDAAATDDPLWNAAQRQLVRDGRIHNYLRMLWGKQVVQWQRSPAAALALLVELNDRYAVDGRDPCSYRGIGWCFGRFDRPWPERPVLGQVRAMSSERTAKKVRVSAYLGRYGPDPTPPRRARGS